MICEVCGDDKVCLTTCGECDLKTFDNIKKQGAVEELEKLLFKHDFGVVGYMHVSKHYVQRRLKELKEGVERWGSPKNTIKKHELNKSLRSDKK